MSSGTLARQDRPGAGDRSHRGRRAALLGLLVLTAGCATGEIFSLAPDARTPGAAGKVQISADGNGNTLLRVGVQYLAPPANLEPRLTTYVVWIRPSAGRQYTNVGQLTAAENRSGTLAATTPFQDFGVLVTAEQSGTVNEPSQYVGLRGNATRP